MRAPHQSAAYLSCPNYTPHPDCFTSFPPGWPFEKVSCSAILRNSWPYLCGYTWLAPGLWSLSPTRGSTRHAARRTARPSPILFARPTRSASCVSRAMSRLSLGHHQPVLLCDFSSTVDHPQCMCTGGGLFIRFPFPLGQHSLSLSVLLFH